MTTTLTPSYDPESSLSLLLRAKSGDPDALNRLLERYIPLLERWASGRMPHAVRSMNDTADIVQEAVVNALRNLETLDIRSDGALLAYLRRAVKNRIIDQYRRHGRRPTRIEIPADAEALEVSPLEAAIGSEALENYERAFESLRPKDQELVVLHVEFGLSHEDIAHQMGLVTTAAARVALSRALRKLWDAMGLGVKSA